MYSGGDLILMALNIRVFVTRRLVNNDGSLYFEQARITGHFRKVIWKPLI
jgi:hypothetical protein